MERTWTTLVPLCIWQCSVVSWRCLLHYYLGSFMQRHASGTSSDSEWINRLLIHLLLLFALTSGVMRNNLFVLKYSYQSIARKKNSNQNDHSLSVAVTRCHLLSFIFTRCYSLCHSFSLVVTRYITCLSFYLQSQKNVYLKIRKKNCMCSAKWILWQKCSSIMWIPTSGNLACYFIKTVHHRHIIAEWFDFFGNAVSKKALITCKGCIFV